MTFRDAAEPPVPAGKEPPPSAAPASTEATPPERRLDAPILALLVLLVLVTKLPTLGVPYLWDETVWVGGALWLADGSLLRALPGLHPPPMFAGHPAGLALLVAPLFKAFSPSVEVAHALSVAFACLGVAATYLLGMRLFGRAAGVLAALFVFASPMYFAQAGMFLGDLPVTALGVTSAWLAVTRRWGPYVAASILLVWVKETGIAVAAAIAIYLLVAGRRPAGTASAAAVGDAFLRLGWRPAIAYGAPPLLAAVAFFVWQKVQTGFFCCIYSVAFDLFESSAEAYVSSFKRVLSWIFIQQWRWVLTALAAAHVTLRPRAFRRDEWILLALVPLLFALPFGTFFYLPRYTLPTLPFVCLAGAWSLVALVRATWARVAMGGAVIGLFLSSWFATDPPGTYEWNLRYLDVVRNHQAIYAVLVNRAPGARVVTHWPHTVQLGQPRMGYVVGALDVVDIHKAGPGASCERVLNTNPPYGDRRLLRYVADRRFRLVRRIDGPGFILAELYEAEACSAPAPNPLPAHAATGGGLNR